MKNSHDTIEPATVRVVAQCLSQCATAFPPVDFNDLLQEDPGLLKEDSFHIVLCFVTVFMSIFFLKLER